MQRIPNFGQSLKCSCRVFPAVLPYQSEYSFAGLGCLRELFTHRLFETFPHLGWVLDRVASVGNCSELVGWSSGLAPFLISVAEQLLQALVALLRLPMVIEAERF